jgi:3'-phosphoadenosine 5'-phosphosulfate sulfotransferase (PAPS reductase)/FAD synthetase
MSEALQATIFGDSHPITEKRAALKKRLSTIQFSEPLVEPMLRVLSLGLGLQSVTLLYMSARGDLPMLDAAIFADTGGEKRATYEYLEYLRGLVPIPIHVVRRDGPSLGEHALSNASLPKGGRQQLPVHTLAPDGAKGMLPLCDR